MTRRNLVLIAAAFVASLSLPAQTPVQKSMHHDFRVVTVAEGLVNPWSIAFLPNGDMLVTERPGRLRIVRGGKLLEKPVEGVPPVLARNQGGLFDVVPHPQFATNRLLYLSFAKPTDESGGATTVVARGRFENDQIAQLEEIFVADSRGAPGHFGARLAFDRNGYLFVSVGDRMVPSTGDLEKHPAQDISNHHGTINRIHDDGRIPADNPFVARDGAKPEIYSYGHRNPQALLVHPETGDVWATEHGPQGGDELNLIRPGMNYGWPVIGFGVNYRSGTAIHSGTHREGMQQPALVWVPSIALSGMLLYTGDKFPEWKGSLFIGGLAGERLDRVTLDGQRAERAEMLVRRQGRIRDVRQGPDGYIYLAIDHRQGEPTRVVRLEPVAR
ncbi:MAG TPA: PQQ-dependent sugar dehydrogenase [Gemmatimonadaceae bacterium]